MDLHRLSMLMAIFLVFSGSEMFDGRHSIMELVLLSLHELSVQTMSSVIQVSSVLLQDLLGLRMVDGLHFPVHSLTVDQACITTHRMD